MAACSLFSIMTEGGTLDCIGDALLLQPLPAAQNMVVDPRCSHFSTLKVCFSGSGIEGKEMRTDILNKRMIGMRGVDQ